MRHADVRRADMRCTVTAPTVHHARVRRVGCSGASASLTPRAKPPVRCTACAMYIDGTMATGAMHQPRYTDRDARAGGYGNGCDVPAAMRRLSDSRPKGAS